MDTALCLENVDRAEALRYMGYGDSEPDSNFSARIDMAEKELIKTARPRFIWKLLGISRKDEECILAGGIRLTGKAICEHLGGCNEALFMAATLSSHCDMLIKKAQARSMTDALITDALASAGIEQICNKAELLIGKELGEKYMTWRFSPGYGDLPLDLQEDILSLLDAQRKIGLTVTDSSVLIPTKSVTAIIGVSEKPLPKNKQGCAYCNMRDRCQFRRKGVHCGNA